jgi:hypothetical protein
LLTDVESRVSKVHDVVVPSHDAVGRDKAQLCLGYKSETKEREYKKEFFHAAINTWQR